MTVSGLILVAFNVIVHVKLRLGPLEVGEVLDLALAVVVEDKVVQRVQVPAANTATETAALLDGFEAEHAAAEVVVLLCCFFVPHPVVQELERWGVGRRCTQVTPEELLLLGFRGHLALVFGWQSRARASVALGFLGLGFLCLFDVWASIAYAVRGDT